MLKPLTLSVPLAEPYRVLAGDAAAKYAELAGCAAPQAASAGAAVTADLGTRAAGAAGDSQVTVLCRTTSTQVDFVIDGPGTSVTLHCARS